ncbi:MAG: ribosome silencing factor [Bacteroidetes bacterium]|nr:MAG: ribosome silencing factor [Bacteroidota bacterium]
MVSENKEVRERELIRVVENAMRSKKARQIVELDLRGIEKRVCDFFIICHADSAPHIKTIAEEVEDRVAAGTGEWPWRMSGMENAQWIVMDYFDVVVHVFSTEARAFYDLESLWQDAVRREVADED